MTKNIAHTELSFAFAGKLMGSLRHCLTLLFLSSCRNTASRTLHKCSAGVVSLWKLERNAAAHVHTHNVID